MSPLIWWQYLAPLRYQSSVADVIALMQGTCMVQSLRLPWRMKSICGARRVATFLLLRRHPRPSCMDPRKRLSHRALASTGRQAHTRLPHSTCPRLRQGGRGRSPPTTMPLAQSPSCPAPLPALPCQAPLGEQPHDTQLLPRAPHPAESAAVALSGHRQPMPPPVHLNPTIRNMLPHSPPFKEKGGRGPQWPPSARPVPQT
jgi:hypothetical protein